MNTLVEFCTNNYFLGTNKVKNILEQKNGYDTLESDCLGHCEECKRSPIAIVEGSFVKANSPDELLIVIENELKRRDELAKIFEEFE